MEPLAVLDKEHRLIERIVGALEAYCIDIEAGRPVERDDLAKFVTLLREHNDHLHHHKEEQLFEAMVSQGFPREHGAIAAVLREHHGASVYIQALANALAQDDWTPEIRDRVADAGRGYAELLRPHIIKEDRVLFPTAEANLDPESMATVAAAFERFEDEHADERVELQALADELIARYFERRTHTREARA